MSEVVRACIGRRVIKSGAEVMRSLCGGYYDSHSQHSAVNRGGLCAFVEFSEFVSRANHCETSVVKGQTDDDFWNKMPRCVILQSHRCSPVGKSYAGSSDAVTGYGNGPVPHRECGSEQFQDQHGQLFAGPNGGHSRCTFSLGVEEIAKESAKNS